MWLGIEAGTRRYERHETGQVGNDVFQIESTWVGHTAAERTAIMDKDGQAITQAQKSTKFINALIGSGRP
jgi:hypothetical protein